MRTQLQWWYRGITLSAALWLSAASFTVQGAEPHDETAHSNLPQRVSVAVSPEWEQRLNLRNEPVRRETLAIEIRAAATVVPAEDQVSHVHTRVAGWIEELYVHNTGEQVEAGQPLVSIFSQELYASQLEYLAARTRSGNARNLTESSRRRLLVMGMSEAELKAIEQQGAAHHLVKLVAPRSGVVLRRSVSPGTAVDPATELLTIADLSSVWIIAEVSERDIPHITAEMPAIVDIPAARASIQTQVDFVYPTVSERTRSLRIRIVIPNENRFFRPGMTAAVTLRGHARAALTIPRDAVVDTGEKQHVFVVTGPGAYEPRTVRVGITTDSRIEILEGLNENEHVLSSGVFLIDSESRLRGSGGGVGHGAHGSAGEVAPVDENPHQGHGE